MQSTVQKGYIYCIKLKEEMLNFANRIDDMLESKSVGTSDLVYIKFFLMTLKEDQAMQHAIDKILPLKKEIEQRNEEFFHRKNNEIFGKLPKDKVNFFSIVWMQKLDKDDKEEIWSFFDTFITFCEEYKKKIC